MVDIDIAHYGVNKIENWASGPNAHLLFGKLVKKTKLWGILYWMTFRQIEIVLIQTKNMRHIIELRDKKKVNRKIEMDEDLVEYCERIKQNYRILSLDEKENIEKILSKFKRDDARYSYSLFNMLDFNNMLSINQADSWRWVRDFIKNKAVIILFNRDTGKNFIEICNGEVFIDFYDESPLEEFYIIDYTGSFLVGYNHSQCLSTFGTASDWLENDVRYKEHYNL